MVQHWEFARGLSYGECGSLVHLASKLALRNTGRLSGYNAPASQQAAFKLHAGVPQPCKRHCSLRVISALQVMSVGWNPFFKNESKTCEPWLLHKFDKDFYDKELR